MHRNVLAAIDARSVIGYDHKNCIRVKRFLLRFLEKLPQGIVRIFDGVSPFSFARIFWNSARRVSKRLVIGNRKSRREKWFAGSGEGSKLFDGFMVEVFIAHAPDGGKSGMGKIFQLNKFVEAVAQRERPHAVKDASPAV